MRWNVLERLPNRTIKAGLPACPTLFLPQTITPRTRRRRPFLPSKYEVYSDINYALWTQPQAVQSSSRSYRVQSCMPVKIRVVEASHTLLAVYFMDALS